MTSLMINTHEQRPRPECSHKHVRGEISDSSSFRKKTCMDVGQFMLYFSIYNKTKIKICDVLRKKENREHHKQCEKFLNCRILSIQSTDLPITSDVFMRCFDLSLIMRYFRSFSGTNFLFLLVISGIIQNIRVLGTRLKNYLKSTPLVNTLSGVTR